MLSKINLKSDLIKYTVVLTSGTVLAQVVGYLLTPIITRLYTPEEFGEFGIIMRVVTFLVVLGAARYEHAIPLPKRDGHAAQIYRLSVRILSWVTIAVLVTSLLFWLLNGIDNKWLLYSILIAGITAATVFINIGRNWAIRMKLFKKITISSLLTSVTGNLGKIALGLLGQGVLGLAIATFFGLIIGGVVYVKDTLHVYSEKYIHSKNRQKVVGKIYDEFPKANLPHAVIDAVRDMIIAFFLTLYFSATTFGSYDLAYRMLRVPLLLVGASISQVLYNRMSTDYAEGKAIYPLLKKSVFVLALIGLIPFTIVYLFGTDLFVFVFGEQWELAGQIAIALTPWLFANFIASSVSIVPSVIGKLKWFFWVGLANTAIQLVAFGFINEWMLYLGANEIKILSYISWIMFFVFAGMTVWLMKLTKEADAKK